mmetsp:Transcript_18583/g.26146  ORF Transcript_18583/g.26146 Transcript_18583/m.26146 type:complete len:88 (-) Transcript_18583:164-427(-)
MYSKPTTAFESIIHSLAEAKADLNVRGVGGKTALMNASGFGFINVVKTLIELKIDMVMHIQADLDLQCRFGLTAIHHCCVGYGELER